MFPKPFKKSRIELDDKFLDRVVPAILEGTTEVKPEGDTLAKFLVINGELRRKNNAKIASFAARRRPRCCGAARSSIRSATPPWSRPSPTSAPMSTRARKSTSRCTSASTSPRSPARPIVAANRGKVLFAEELGIYGNCVILDHGMGVQSLYGHLSSIDVKPGQTVEKEQQLGRSGMTGLAGGDHLHFTMLVNGQMVNPVEWWDPHWIEDRILRKLRDAGGH